MAELMKFHSCEHKQQLFITLFEKLQSTEAKYQKIIELGKLLSPMPEIFKCKENLVSGCQSTLYIASFLEPVSPDPLINFYADSDALISKGLAYLLVETYSKEHPLALLHCPPLFLKQIGIPQSISMTRSNGLASLYLRMKQNAINLLTELAIE